MTLRSLMTFGLVALAACNQSSLVGETPPDLSPPSADAALNADLARPFDLGPPEGDLARPPDMGPPEVTYRWQAVTPVSTSANLLGVWGFSDDDLWIAGDFGTILHWDGLHFTNAYQSDINDVLYAIWGSAPNDLWVAGYHVAPAQNSDGGTPTLTPRAFYFNGIRWSEVDELAAYQIQTLFGFSSTDVWAATSDGRLIHFDGTHWNLSFTSDGRAFRALWGASSSDVWAGGDSGLLVHFNGTSWSDTSTGLNGQHVYGIFGGDAPDVAVVTTPVLSPSPSPSPGQAPPLVSFEAFSFDSSSNGWISASSGGGNAYCGSSVPGGGTRYFGDSLPIPRGRGLWGSRVAAPANSYSLVATQGEASRCGNEGFAFDVIPGQHTQALAMTWTRPFSDVWGSGSDLFAVGFAGYFAVLDIGGGLAQTVASNPDPELFGVSVGADGDAWALKGDDGAPGVHLAHLTGSNWQTIPLSIRDAISIAVVSATDVWLGARVDFDSGALIHYDGSSWTTVSLAGLGLSAYYQPMVCARAADDVWATVQPDFDIIVSRESRVLHYDGKSWAVMPWTLPDYDSQPFCGTTAGDVWFVSGGDVLHWHGQTLSTPLGGVTVRAQLWVAGPDDVFLAESNAQPRHWNGADWTPLPTLPLGEAGGVWGTDDKNVWFITNAPRTGAGGAAWAGQVIRWDGSTMTLVEQVSSRLSSIAGSGPNAMAVGDATALRLQTTP